MEDVGRHGRPKVAILWVGTLPPKNMEPDRGVLEGRSGSVLVGGFGRCWQDSLESHGTGRHAWLAFEHVPLSHP